MTTATPIPSSGPLARALRYLLRTPLLAWHLFVHLTVVMIVVVSPLGRMRLRSGESLGHRIIRAWQAGLMRVFGFRLRRSGTPLPGAVLFVANHVSWIDIVALHSQHMMGFVAKKEIAGWPVVGWLAKHGETIFHQRGSQESLGGVLEEMQLRLREGRAVGVFPEGRTRDGAELGPFHARIFTAAVETGVPVQPVALRYGTHGEAQRVVAFRGRESFVANFFRLLGEAPRDAEVAFLEPMMPGDADGRRRIAEVSRERIMAALGQAPRHRERREAHEVAADAGQGPRRVTGTALPASAYAPPPWLRNAHVQSVLGSSQWRRQRGARALVATGAVTTEHLLDGGDGVRLHGLHSTIEGRTPRGLALLLHGWEGSTESSYMRLTAARFLRAGFDVFRLNFRDHGPTHHLNEELFHSARIDEVVHAAADVCARFPARPLVAAGYSLGGNFALRLALRAPGAGLPLVAVSAVCPVLDPALTLQRMERGMPIYLHHFERKWRESLVRKRSLFPHRLTLDDSVLRLGMRDLTEWLVLRHTAFSSLDEYFQGYSIAGDRLAGLGVPAHVLTSEDDPVIPADGFRALPDNPCLQVEIARWGGHCGFIENARLDGYAERWAVERLLGDPQVVAQAAAH